MEIWKKLFITNAFPPLTQKSATYYNYWSHKVARKLRRDVIVKSLYWLKIVIFYANGYLSTKLQ